MNEPGFVVWLTGLSGAGKSTLAGQLAGILHAQGRRVEVLDGDELRRTLSPEVGFSREDRERHVTRVAHVARLLERHGVAVLVALISPYRDSRAAARHLIERFLEVYVACPLDRCIERDPKGLYEQALAGSLTHFTGVSDPYEPPEAADVVIHTDQDTPEACVQAIVAELGARAWAWASAAAPPPAPASAYSAVEEAEITARLASLGYV